MAEPGGRLGFNPFQQTATQIAQKAADTGGNQGVITGVRAPLVAAVTPAQTTASPPTAVDAPSKGNNNIFTGLCDALNQYQKELVKKGTYEIADVYEINFAPPSIGSSKVTKPGSVVYKNTAPKNVNTAADKVDSATDQVNTNSQTWQVAAGTQIVQFIDQVMRSSTYITGQQKVNFDDAGKATRNASAGSGGVTAWYKISLTTKQLGYDKKRRDNAYRMTFTISPYAINQMASPYFPDSNYRGAHKAFNYWFTGMNTQILSYEQEYNQAYYVTLTGNPDALASPPPKGRDQFKQTHMATSEVRGQGQANYVNEPADSAAAFLYSVTDFAEVHMRIVGDPAWMQQGEAAFGVNAQTFDFKPFNSDGGINYDSQEVVFTVSFNRPSDYNFNTGIMNVNDAQGAPQETFAYIAKSVKNTFSKGKFEQELVGSLLPLENTSQPASTNGRTTPTPSMPVSTRDTTNSAVSAADEVNPEKWNDGTATKTEDIQAQNNPSTPQPAAPPGAPTSTGDIVETSGGAPADASAAFRNGSNDQVALAAANQASADAAAASGDLYAAANFNRQAQINRENAALEARSAAKYGAVNTPPQNMNKET
jgi:hypothetical protein